MTTRAHLLFGLLLAELLVAVGGAWIAGLEPGDAVASYFVPNVAIGASFGVCGWLIARSRPQNPVGWLFLVLGLAPLTTAATVPALQYGLDHGWSRLVLDTLATIFAAAWPWGTDLCLPLALQLVPTGQPVSPRWRLLIWATLLIGTLNMLVGAFTADLALKSPGRQPMTLLAPYWPSVLSPLIGVLPVLVTLVMLASVASLVVRYVYGGEVVRRQLLWLVMAVVVAVSINLPTSFGTEFGNATILLFLAVPLIPAAITVGILRYQLFDIRLVLARTLQYVVLTAGVTLLYLAFVALLDRAFRGIGAPVLATFAIALAFNPIRTWLQRLVDRMLYGARRDPVRAVSAVGRLLADDDLTVVLQGIRSVLRLPFAAVRSNGSELAATGVPATGLQVVAMTFRGERVGELVVGARAGERRLASADLEALNLLATPLAIAVHATRLSDDLKVSRQRLVTAAEEERRRLHRELHDSLGPALTGAAFKVQAVSHFIDADPATATRLNGELGDQIRDAIDDIRRLVYGLRPPALDEVGLVGAIRRVAAQFDTLKVEVDISGAMPTLPAAVEVAAYRIVSEALTNAVRHSTGRLAFVRLRATAADLHLTITDSGTTDEPNGEWQAGVGLRSMRERAEELGGTLVAQPAQDGGQVLATLPLGGLS
ncbi:histidine kinase [Kribbella sp. NBC_01505]|uniref:sensor histidine kinase n=1 Tax=Kribbella sp. NBC_01505 TaxID=2903580 RepID=UPI003868A9F6